MVRGGCFVKFWWWKDGGYGGGRGLPWASEKGERSRREKETRNYLVIK